MPVHEIPASFQHVCDGCGKSIQQPGKSRPPHWSDLTIGRDAYDHHGAAVADGTIRRLLCDGCTNTVVVAVNGAIPARAALGGDTSPEGRSDG